VGDFRQSEVEDDRRVRGDDRKPCAQRVVGSAVDPEQEWQGCCAEGEHVDRAGQALNDLPCRHAGDVKEPAANGKRADDAASRPCGGGFTGSAIGLLVGSRWAPIQDVGDRAG
jgi:hypothetical protein